MALRTLRIQHADLQSKRSQLMLLLNTRVLARGEATV